MKKQFGISYRYLKIYILEWNLCYELRIRIRTLDLNIWVSEESSYVNVIA